MKKNLYIPKKLLNEKKYKNLGLNSILIYSYFLDKILNNEAKKDQKGYLYLNVSLDEIEDFFKFKLSRSTIIKSNLKLIKHDLLKIKKRGKFKKNIYYLLKP